MKNEERSMRPTLNPQRSALNALLARMKRVRETVMALAVCCAFGAWGATKQETAFLSVWTVHSQSPDNHAAVIAACQRVMDTSATLGEFLPVVKTLAGWHLLAAGKEADAVRVLESVLTADKKPAPMARYADIMARRWLSRLDIRKVDAALKSHYADNVEYPVSLAPILSLPKPAAPAKTDRFGDTIIVSEEPLKDLNVESLFADDPEEDIDQILKELKEKSRRNKTE